MTDQSPCVSAPHSQPTGNTTVVDKEIENKENQGERDQPVQREKRVRQALTESYDFGDSDDSVKDVTFSPSRNDDFSDVDSPDSDVVANKSNLSKNQQRTVDKDSDDSVVGEPLVNRCKLGEKRRNTQVSNAAVSDLDLIQFFKDRPLCEAVLVSYQKNTKLNEDDRRTLCKSVVSWLLPSTDYRPTQHHFRILTEKLLSIFPTEKASMWFLPPGSEGRKQKGCKGKLPDKARNAKCKLRKKGLLPQVKRRRQSIGEETNPAVAVPFDLQEKASKAWLARNNHPFHDVQKHWATCRVPRLKELFLNSRLTVAQYNKDWNGILKLPESYQLVLDDFKALHEVFAGKYGGLQSVSEDVTQHWIDFREKVVQALPLCGLGKKDMEAVQARLASAVNENSKDYIILSVLPFICKLKCMVKVGKKQLKPTALESQKAFLMCVSGPGEFEEKKRARREIYATLKAPVQPYIGVIVQEDTVSASYVIVDDIVWKASSVLQALEVCFKSHFSLHCEYAPEVIIYRV